MEIPFETCPAACLTREFVKMKLVEKEAKKTFSERISFDIFLAVLKVFQQAQDAQFLHMNKRGI